MNKINLLTAGARSFDKEGYAEEDGEANAAIFVKYDRMLHGQDRRRGKKAKQDRLTIKFLKKYIHYAKNLIQPRLTDEVTVHMRRDILLVYQLHLLLVMCITSSSTHCLHHRVQYC